MVLFNVYNVQWESVNSLGRLPSLEVLLIDSAQFPVAHGIDAREVGFSLSLSLSLSLSPLSLSPLSHYSSHASSDISLVLLKTLIESIFCFQVLIAKLPRIVMLNRADVSVEERRSSEIR